MSSHSYAYLEGDALKSAWLLHILFHQCVILCCDLQGDSHVNSLSQGAEMDTELLLLGMVDDSREYHHIVTRREQMFKNNSEAEVDRPESISAPFH